jgi:hypothetical protein
MSKRGLPYIEAGDAVRMTAEDGSVINSFVLRQVISGIQQLFADVESANGEALEMIET